MFDESTNLETTTADSATTSGVSRRAVLRLGAVGAAGVALTAAGEFGAPYLAQKGLLSTDGAFAATATALGDLLFYKEKFPTSPLILTPFNDPLPIPKALAPIPVTEFSNWPFPPGPGDGQQNSLRNERHQKWVDEIGSPDPIVYKIELKVGTHSFTTSQVLPINSLGQPAVSFDATGKRYPVGTKRKLPYSTIYGFNGVFPG
ncbi:MAG: copper oxidase, partial [Cellulomonas sp.]